MSTFHIQTSKFVWSLALLLVLVLAQALLATHETFHLTEEHDDAQCEICSIGGNLNQAALPAGLQILQVALQTQWICFTYYTFHSCVLPAYWARGPPCYINLS